MKKPEPVDENNLRERLRGNEIVVANGLPRVISVEALIKTLLALGNITQVVTLPGEYPPETHFPLDGQELTVLFCNLGEETELQQSFIKKVLGHSIPVLIVTQSFPRGAGLVSIARRERVREIVSADLETSELLQVIYRILKGEERVYD